MEAKMYYVPKEQFKILPGNGNSLLLVNKPRVGEAVIPLSEAKLSNNPQVLSAPVPDDCLLLKACDEQYPLTGNLVFSDIDTTTRFFSIIGNHYCCNCLSKDSCPSSLVIEHKSQPKRITLEEVAQKPLGKILKTLYENMDNSPLTSRQIATRTGLADQRVRDLMSEAHGVDPQCIDNERGPHGGYHMVADPLTRCAGCSLANFQCHFRDYLIDSSL